VHEIAEPASLVADWGRGSPGVREHMTMEHGKRSTQGSGVGADIVLVSVAVIMLGMAIADRWLAPPPPRDRSRLARAG
jgi:hypothetical protein